MKADMRLIYIASQAIVEYCTDHPIVWSDPKLTDGDGNKKTPTPAVEVFYKLIAQTERLFTQDDYWEYARQEWYDWLSQQTEPVFYGLKARRFRNFYPSCIDTLHAWALLAESGHFAYCILDPIRDAVAKTDISVHTLDGRSIGVALYVASERSEAWTKYKRTYRGKVENVIDVCLPMTRRRKPGNKRWYCIDDFAPVYAALNMAYHTTIVAMPVTVAQTTTQPTLWASNNYNLDA